MTRSAPRNAASGLLGALVAYSILALPNHPDAATIAVLRILPLELPIMVGALVVAGASRSVHFPIRIVVALFLAAALVIKAGDYALFSAFARPFNPVYDLPLLAAGWNLLKGSSGLALASAYIVLLALLVAGIGWAIWWSTGAIGRLGPMTGARPVAGLAAIAAVLVIVLVRPLGPPAEAFTTRLFAEHVTAAAAARRDIEDLTQEAESDAALDRAGPHALTALRERDVVIAFIESYGRSTLDNPFYRDTTRAALADMQAELSRVGYAMRSAWLTSPIVGGQSWLAHATLLSGLRIDSQGRYEALLRSQRKALPAVARKARFRSVAVMPAIVMDWPESAWFGYWRVLAAADLGYRGPPFNWVTMPDQYTWSAFERQELTPGPRDRVFAEIALISSHAPWTPVPVLIDWEAVGDGSAFAGQARSGPSPEELWSDRDRVSDHFRQTIDYALRTAGSFAARRAQEKPLFVILGDHQPATFVSGDTSSAEVPIHVIGDPLTIARLDAWGWTPGLVPAPDAPVWPMSDFRGRFLDAFSGLPAK